MVFSRQRRLSSRNGDQSGGSRVRVRAVESPTVKPPHVNRACLVVAVVLAVSCDQPPQTVANDTCIAYFEADERLKAQLAEADALLEADGNEALHSARTHLAKLAQRGAYLAAYRGAKSADQNVMTKLVNADRRRCCEKFRTHPRCPFVYIDPE